MPSSLSGGLSLPLSVGRLFHNDSSLILFTEARFWSAAFVEMRWKFHTRTEYIKKLPGFLPEINKADHHIIAVMETVALKKKYINQNRMTRDASTSCGGVEGDKLWFQCLLYHHYIMAYGFTLWHFMYYACSRQCLSRPDIHGALYLISHINTSAHFIFKAPGTSALYLLAWCQCSPSCHRNQWHAQ